ncbi:MAG: glycosyltransferase [Candidatus Shapirobacteria bacterium]|jgi:hypothetical protein
MKKSPRNNPVYLSVVVLNFNSGHYLSACVDSISKSRLRYPVEAIVIDNCSSDDSFILAQKKLAVRPPSDNLSFKFQRLNNNIGFSAGNNRGVELISPDSRYVLFLNPDTIVNPDSLNKMMAFFLRHPQADAATCFVKLALTNRLQPECHRGFPTPWRSLCHFSGISKLLPTSAVFSGYFLGNLNIKETHRIEACVGAFLMLKKTVGQNLGWWNEKYFFYGEDLDFCYRLYQNNYKLYFYPHCSITHFQGISSGIKKTKSAATRPTRVKAAQASTEAMRIFYQDHLFGHYNFLTRSLVLAGIKLLEIIRVTKAKYL